MNLKVLTVPFLVVMMLIIAIGYIWPDLSALPEKRAAVSEKEENAASVGAVMNNIDALNGSLDAQKETEQLVDRYFPENMDQGHAIDALNFMASQAGISMSGLDIEVSNSKLNEQVSDGAATTAQRIPKLSKYVVTAKVSGSYEGIKDFFNRVSHMDLFHKVISFSISVDTKNGASAGSAAAAAGGALTGAFEAEFGYMPKRPATVIESDPIFRSSQLDFAVANRLTTFITNIVPTTDNQQTGKPNPFQ
jgi:hypothetical protein